MSQVETTAEKPYWERGNLAPVFEEVTAFDLPVEGAIPPELNGLYARNGANPREGHAGHWFMGDGMLHGVSLKDGKAEWYRNRWVRTPRFNGAPSRPGIPDIRASTANTNVIAHAGKIMALVENALPMMMTRDLDTVGFHDYGGKLDTPFTAHPKICPTTGEMHFFGYGFMPPFLTYHAVDASGALLRSIPIPTKTPTMMHDFAMTSDHVIFMDLPVVFDMPAAQRGTMPFAWNDSYGARLGILKRGAGIESLRWVEIDPCYVFHVANAFEETDGSIVIDVAWYNELWRGGPSATTFDKASLKRWRIPPGATKAQEQLLDDKAIEFPRVNESLTGSRHNIVYSVDTGSDLASGRYTSVRKYDLKSGNNTVHDFGTGVPSEFVHIAPEGSTGEDDGWLMGFVYDRARDASDLVILDAQKIESKPVARIGLPARVPQGFHGNWMPGV
ncbi:MAG: carotenoid cleavage dioxygenase [Afipia broomeae]|jgi:carotenoid cleavage dioxygenase|uniref:Lignostilbene-alpha,beta-dioxygenase n=1 Tax=Syncephalis pseudoplumigaleata TaxID=1712513 RepID=A0A4P9Z936_9FUNG|nr:lignostilbene-alpha,beta-dioxygenase [Syncephalis pseudoplumigaleata]RTL75266.1 MAG: 9-cis-epoxycarotenoid dioxygenase [Bradyrhizobiaceae bacterium]|eukprot:RKP28270.1 lignostilbene-alpha,beta-dioxygenase [Syncephalis pseudoplumigaleata]